MVTCGWPRKIVPLTKAKRVARPWQHASCLHDHHKIPCLRSGVVRKTQLAWQRQCSVIENGPGILDFIAPLGISRDHPVNDVSILVHELAVQLAVIHERKESEPRVQLFG